MKKSYKGTSSDELIKQTIDVISELSNRGINFFQYVVDTYGKLKKDAGKMKKIIKSKGEQRGGKKNAKNS